VNQKHLLAVSETEKERFLGSQTRKAPPLYIGREKRKQPKPVWEKGGENLKKAKADEK